MMLQTWGVSEVARWCGVTPNAVSGWRQRYGRWPVKPAAEINSGGRRYYGWTADQRAEWERWAGAVPDQRPAAMPDGPWQARIRGGDLHMEREMENVNLTERELAVLKFIASSGGRTGRHLSVMMTNHGMQASSASVHRTAASLIAKHLVARMDARPVRYEITPLGVEVLRRAAKQARTPRELRMWTT